MSSRKYIVWACKEGVPRRNEFDSSEEMNAFMEENKLYYKVNNLCQNYTIEIIEPEDLGIKERIRYEIE